MGPPDAQLAFLVIAYILPRGGVDQPHLAVKDRLAHRSQLWHRLFVGHAKAVGAHLGEAVTLAKDPALGRQPLLGQLGRQRRPAADEKAHVAEIGFGKARVIHEHPVDGRHAQDHRALLVEDGLKDGIPVKGAEQQNPPADVKERRQKGEQPSGVEKGREHRRNVALVQPPTGDGIETVVEDLPVGDHGSFGQPRRARGVEDGIGVVGVQGRARWLGRVGCVQAGIIVQRALDPGALQPDGVCHLYPRPHLTQ